MSVCALSGFMKLISTTLSKTSSILHKHRTRGVLKYLVNWFSSGLQSAFRKSIGSVRGSERVTLALALSLSRSLALARSLSLSLSLALTHSLTTVHSVSRTARSRRLEGKLHDQPPTAERNTPSSLYTQNTSHLPDEARHSKYQKHLQSKHLP